MNIHYDINNDIKFLAKSEIQSIYWVILISTIVFK